MEEKNYIFQLNKKDMQDISAATNPVPGFCIRIERSQGQLKIGIDENALKMAINGFIRNGGGTATAANCVNISMNPPS